MKTIWLGDDVALEINVIRFAKTGLRYDSYVREYDARRVKRARRAAVRRGWWPRSNTVTFRFRARFNPADFIAHYGSIV